MAIGVVIQVSRFGIRRYGTIHKGLAIGVIILGNDVSNIPILVGMVQK